MNFIIISRLVHQVQVKNFILIRSRLEDMPNTYDNILGISLKFCLFSSETLNLGTKINYIVFLESLSDPS